MTSPWLVFFLAPRIGGRGNTGFSSSFARGLHLVGLYVHRASTVTRDASTAGDQCNAASSQLPIAGIATT